MVVSGQVSIIHIGVIGASDVTRVVKAVPRGLLHKKDGVSGQEAVRVWGRVWVPQVSPYSPQSPGQAGQHLSAVPAGGAGVASGSCCWVLGWEGAPAEDRAIRRAAGWPG